MTKKQIKLFSARAEAFRSNLSSNSGDSGSLVSIELAKHYNSLRKDIVELLDDETSAMMPNEIPWGIGTFVQLGKTEVTPLDLKIFIDQILNILEIESDDASN